jgi:ABC-2 type transport system permease protein
MRRVADGGPAAARVGLAEVLRAEASKLRTMRSAWWTLAAMVASILGVAAFVGATRSLQPDDTVLGGSLTGASFGLLVGASFGVLMISGEQVSGMLRTTFLACPRRGVVLAAKAALTAISLFVVALAACSLAFLAGSAMLSGHGYPTGAPMPALLGVALCFSATGLLGLAVGTMLRHPAGAVTTMVGGILLPSLLGPLLGTWGRWLAGASPVAALQKLSQSSDATAGAVGSLAAWPSLLLLGGVATVLLLGAAALLRRRDVGAEVP